MDGQRKLAGGKDLLEELIARTSGDLQAKLMLTAARRQQPKTEQVKNANSLATSDVDSDDDDSCPTESRGLNLIYQYQKERLANKKNPEAIPGAQ